MARVEGIEQALYEIEGHITTGDALKLLRGGVTLPTLIKWCREYHIGKKVGGRWYVDPDKLSLLLKGIQVRDGY